MHAASSKPAPVCERRVALRGVLHGVQVVEDLLLYCKTPGCVRDRSGRAPSDLLRRLRGHDPAAAGQIEYKLMDHKVRFGLCGSSE